MRRVLHGRVHDGVGDVQLKDPRLTALVLSAVLAACRNAPPPDGPSGQRGAAAAPGAAATPAAHRRPGADRGVASTDAALLVGEAGGWR